MRQVEAQVKQDRPQRGKSTRESKPREAAERRLEEELQRALGTDVRIRRGRGKKGKIEIPFYGAEDFERIYELLAGAIDLLEQTDIRIARWRAGRRGGILTLFETRVARG